MSLDFFGHGKKAKKIRLQSYQSRINSKLKKVTKPGLDYLLRSDFYKNFKPSKEFLDYQNFKDFYKETFNPGKI
jgi:hypothetical protein